jgi:hypothetical protein
VIKPYTREFFAPRPSAVTLFFRTFLPWQLVRFSWINLKMIQMIRKAHSRRALPPAAGTSSSGRESLGATRAVPIGGYTASSQRC